MGAVFLFFAQNLQFMKQDEQVLYDGIYVVVDTLLLSVRIVEIEVAVTIIGIDEFFFFITFGFILFRYPLFLSIVEFISDAKTVSES